MRSALEKPAETVEDSEPSDPSVRPLLLKVLAPDGRPVVGATVSFRNPMVRRSLGIPPAGPSDAQGRILLDEGWPPGLPATVRATGFLPKDVDPPSPSIEEWTIVLEPWARASLAGRVVYADGTPAAGAKVWVSLWRFNRSILFLQSGGQLQTRSRRDGKFEFSPVPAGMPLMVGASGVEGARGRAWVGALPDGGRKEDVLVELPQVRDVVVTTVSSETGEPVANVRIGPPNHETWRAGLIHWDIAAGSVRTDEGGRAVVPVRKDRGVVLEVDAPLPWRDTWVRVRPEQTSATVRLRRDRDYTLRLVGLPEVIPCEVAVKASTRGSLQGGDGCVLTAPGRALRLVATNGETTEEVGSDRLFWEPNPFSKVARWISPMAPPFHLSVFLGESLLAEALVEREGPVEVAVDLARYCRRGGFALRVVRPDGSPAYGLLRATMTAVGEDGRPVGRPDSTIVLTDEQGFFDRRNLVRGRYRLRMDSWDQDATAGSVDFAVTPGEVAWVGDLVLRPKARVRVRIDGPVGVQPVEVRVWSYEECGYVLPEEADPGADYVGFVGAGELLLTRLPPGPARVEVAARGFSTFREDVRLTAGETAAVRAALSPGIPLTLIRRGGEETPWIDFSVTSETEGWTERLRRSVDGADGTARAQFYVPLGRYRVRSEGEGLDAAEASVKVVHETVVGAEDWVAVTEGDDGTSR